MEFMNESDVPSLTSLGRLLLLYGIARSPKAKLPTLKRYTAKLQDNGVLVTLGEHNDLRSAVDSLRTAGFVRPFKGGFIVTEAGRQRLRKYNVAIAPRVSKIGMPSPASGL